MKTGMTFSKLSQSLELEFTEPDMDIQLLTWSIHAVPVQELNLLLLVKCY